MISQSGLLQIIDLLTAILHFCTDDFWSHEVVELESVYTCTKSGSAKQ
jgi:hypothetical protein